MQNGTYADPCGSFQYGEVEDYTVQILPGGGIMEDNNQFRTGLDFTAFKQDETIQLHWVTNNIDRPHHFLLEQSDDGVYFNPVIEVDSRTISENAVEYSSAIPQPEKGAYFYRVQLVYEDGENMFSKSKMLEFQSDAREISIFPNPASTELYANLAQFHGMASTVTIHNAKGEQVFQQVVDRIPSSLLRFDLAHLPKGMYLISFDFGREVVITKQLIMGGR